MGGKTPSKSRPTYWTGGVPWVSPKDMKRLDIDGSQDEVSQSAVDDGLTLIPAGAVLVVVRSGILKHTVPVAVTSVPCTVNQDIKALVCCPSVLPEYVRLMIQGFQTFILENLTKTGTTVESMKVREFFSEPFLFPPRAEQYRIVARVDELMALLDRLEAAKEARDATRAQLRDAALAALQDANDAAEVKTAWSRIADHMHDLFTDPADIPSLRETVLQLAVRGQLVPQDPTNESACVVLDRLALERAQLVTEEKITKPKLLPPIEADEVPFEVPEGWAWCRLQEIAALLPRAIQSGPFGSTLRHSEFVSDGKLVIGIDNTQDGFFSIGSNHRITEDKFRTLEKYRARPNDLLITVMGTIGRCCLVPTDIEPAIVTKHVYRISLANGAVVPRYLMHMIRGAPAMREQMFGQVRGLTRDGLNGSIIRALMIPLPPIAEQELIVTKVDALMAMLDRLDATLRSGRETQDAFCASAVRALPQVPLEVGEGSAVAVG